MCGPIHNPDPSSFISSFQSMSTPHPPSSSSTTMEPPDNEEADKDDADDVVGWLLMEQCWSDCAQQLQGCAVRFIQDPYSSLLVFQSSSSYVTINGNEESCGSSFADCGTSFMATLHSTTPSSPSLCTNFNAAAADNDEDKDDDDELLSTFLGLRDNQHHGEEDLLLSNPQLPSL